MANSEVKCPKCGTIVPERASYCQKCGTHIFRDAAGDGKPDPYIGNVINGKFKVESILGTGSMGIVYKAQDLAHNQKIALKVLKQELISDHVILARFHREAKAASSLSHPNIIQIKDYGKTHLGAPYIAMECLDGTELAELAMQKPPKPQLSQKRICNIVLQTCQALIAAHAANIIHRDLKPANIIVIQQGNNEIVKVLDFGIAKITDGDSEGLTKEGAICGTPAFMSPEQVLGKNVVPASDLFSLGSILYFLLTKMLPFSGQNLVDMATSILSTDPLPPSRARLDKYVDPKLEKICLKALEKDLILRYSTALEMAKDLEDAYQSIPDVDPPVKNKIVIGEACSLDDINGETRCGIDAYIDDTVLDGDGATNLEVPAMNDSLEVMQTESDVHIPNQPDPLNPPSSISILPILSHVSSVGDALRSVFMDDKPPTIAPEDCTVIKDGPSHLLGEDDPNEDVVLERKKLLLGVVCIVAALCIVIIIVMFIVTRVSGSSDDSEDTPMQASEPMDEPQSELSMARIDFLLDDMKPAFEKSMMHGAFYGVAWIPEGSKEDDEAETDIDIQTETETEAEPETEPVPQTKPNHKTTSKKKSSKKPSKKTTGKTGSSSGSSKLKEAMALEASGKKQKACQLYKALSKDSSISKSDRLKAQNKARSCGRISI